MGAEQWQAYREFLELVKEGLLKLRDEKTVMSETLRRHRSILERAYVKVNAKHPKARLMSLWDRLRIPKPLSAYARYQREPDPSTGKDTLSRSS